MNTAAHLAVLHKHPWDDGDSVAAFVALVDAGFVDDAVDAWLASVDVDDDAHVDIAEVVHQRCLGGLVARKALALLEHEMWPDAWRAVVEFVVDADFGAGFDVDRVWAILERVRVLDVQLWCALVPHDPRAVPLLRRIVVEHAGDPWIVNEAVGALAARATNDDAALHPQVQRRAA